MGESMKETRFGRIKRLSLEGVLSRRCEVMHFESRGTPHTHKRTEIAICVSGSGIVQVGAIGRPVYPGDYINIPGGQEHYMEPFNGEVLSMLIAYLVEDT